MKAEAQAAAHKINNTVGPVLLARFGLDCVVYMGEEDMARQELNVFRRRDHALYYRVGRRS